MKRVISIFLTITILLALMPTISFAAMGDYDGNITGATWYWPLHGYSSTSSAYSMITSSYGYRGGSYNGYHRGVDIGASKGTSVYPTRKGTVSEIHNSTSGSYGRYVIINHNDGYFSIYMHLSRIDVSEKGQSVGVNTQIGAVGGSGYNSETAYANHLHMGIHYGSSFSFDCSVNPCPSGYTRIGNSLQASAGGYPIGSASISYSVNYNEETSPDTEAPTFATLSTNKENYNINENVIFTFNADNNAKYTLAIYKGDTRIDTIEVRESTYTRTFVESGMYTAYITAYNDAGYKDSNWIGWEIKLPEPPSNISFSTNKTQYSVGETVKFLCNATNANGYTIAIYKDANRVYQGDIPSSFSKTFTEKGNYSAYISAWNSYGLIDSKRIYFTVYDTAPINCTLTVNTSTIYSGNKIIFTANANYANGYTIGIYKNGERIYTGDIGSVFEKTFDDVGNYSAYVTAWNNIGLVDSKRVFFNVEALSECKLEINKTVIRTNENITFSCQAENATGYTIGIDKDGIRICTESIEKICTKSFTQAGNYYAYVTAWNSQGISDSNSVRFVVYDTAPQSSELLIDKTSIAVGDSINFTCNSPQATGYTIGIYKNGTRIFTSDIDKNFTKQFSETGEYSAYVTAWNAIGICDSKRVTFEVYNAIPDSCSIVADKQKVEVGGVVNLKFDAHNAKLFEIVTYINGEQVWITPSRGNYNELELEIKDSGIYEVWATAYNEYGYCNSEHITFIAYNNDNAVVIKNNNSVRIVKKLNINYNGYSCIIALYDGRRLVKCVNKPNLSGTAILDETILYSDKYDEIKVMNWNNLSELMPLCEAEVIPSSEFIVE